MRVGNARHIFVLQEGARGSLSGPRITRKFPGAMFDQITSDLEGDGAVSTVGIRGIRYLYAGTNFAERASERTLARIDFISCHSSMRLIDGNTVKRATSRLLTRQVDLMAYLARVLDSLATVRHVPPSTLSHSTLCSCPPFPLRPSSLSSSRNWRICNSDKASALVEHKRGRQC